MSTMIETATPTIVYGLLPQERWGELVPIFSQYNVPPPQPETALASVAEVNGRIVGVLMVQPQVHAHTEPLWIAEEYRQSVKWWKLLANIDAFYESIGCCGYVYAFADNERIESFLRRAGYQKLNYTVWIRPIGCLDETEATNNGRHP